MHTCWMLLPEAVAPHRSTCTCVPEIGAVQITVSEETARPNEDDMLQAGVPLAPSVISRPELLTDCSHFDAAVHVSVLEVGS